MSDQQGIPSASEFLDRHFGLRQAMAESRKFAELKAKLPPPLSIDEEDLYFGLYGDVPVSEDELYLTSLLQGARQRDARCIYGELYAELSDDLKAVIADEAHKK